MRAAPLSYPMLVSVVSWLIAGGVASWLASATAPQGAITLPLDWVAGPVGALLGAAILAVVTGRALDTLDWWFSIPAAFLAAVLAIGLFRIVLRARPLR